MEFEQEKVQSNIPAIDYRREQLASLEHKRHITNGLVSIWSARAQFIMAVIGIIVLTVVSLSFLWFLLVTLSRY